MPLWCSRCSRERQGELARGCILTSSGCALRRYAGAVGARGGDDAAADRRIARIGTALFPPGLCGTVFSAVPAAALHACQSVEMFRRFPVGVPQISTWIFN